VLHNRKGAIRKAAKDSITIEKIRTVDALRVLSFLTEESMERHGKEGIALNALLPKKALIDAGCADVYVANYGGDVVAALMVTIYNGKGYTLHGGNSHDGLKVNAPSLLWWQAALDLKGRGLAQCTLGGVPASSEHEGDPQYGLYRFKRSFGAEARPCSSGAIDNLSRARGALAKRLRMLKR
jgi:lipid II:glycine glycyltransferase (peptidoglycan interpeptide bridge formation enzyme)